MAAVMSDSRSELVDRNLKNMVLVSDGLRTSDENLRSDDVLRREIFDAR